MLGDPENVAPPAEFLKELGEALSAQEGVDIDLANILRDHLLQELQQQHAVASAGRAIADLALSRAKVREA